jgi:hypothetical protein
LPPNGFMTMWRREPKANPVDSRFVLSAGGNYVPTIPHRRYYPWGRMQPRSRRDRLRHSECA